MGKVESVSPESVSTEQDGPERPPWPELWSWIKKRYGKQKHFATAVGRSEQIVSDWVNGKRGLKLTGGRYVRSPDVVERIRGLPGVTAEDLRELKIEE